MYISTPLKIIMTKNNIKNKTLAKDLGVAVNTISSWRNNRVRISGDMFDKLIDYLGISKSEFFKAGE